MGEQLRSSGVLLDCAAPVVTATGTQRLDHFLIGVMCHDPEASLRRVFEDERGSHNIFLLPRSVARALRAEEPRGQRATDLYRVPHGDQPELFRLHPVDPFSGPGGVFSLLSLQIGVDGHTEITEAALRTLTRRSKLWAPLSADGWRAIVTGAASPDFRQWAVPAAHALTAHDLVTGERGSAAVSQDAWASWVRAEIETATTAADLGHYGEAMFHLGCAAHAVQDLATNRGMSAVQKSYSQFVAGTNPDEDTGLIDLSQTLAADFLEAVAGQFPSTTWSAMVRWSGELDASSFGKRDMTLAGLLDYVAMARRFEAEARKPVERWCDGPACRTMVRSLAGVDPAHRVLEAPRR
jgi:hypothetical protein